MTFTTTRRTFERDMLAAGIRLHLSPEERKAGDGAVPNYLAARLATALAAKRKDKIEITRLKADAAQYKSRGRRGLSDTLLRAGKALPRESGVQILVTLDWHDRYPVRIAWQRGSSPWAPGFTKGHMRINYSQDWAENTKEDVCAE